MRTLLSTVATLRPEQVGGRLLFPLRQRRALRSAPEPGAEVRIRGVHGVAPPPEHHPWGDGERLKDGWFAFLRTPHRLGWPPDWSGNGASLLWRFNLHYLEWLVALGAEDRAAAARAWVEGNPPAPGAAWHPYPTSLRLVNLLRQGVDEPRVVRSLYRQAAFLHRCVEYHVMGNHLLENARALVLAGVAFRGQGEAEEWLEHGLAVFRDELPRQVLSDGGHEERSPMYHALVLEGLLDAVNALRTQEDRAEDRSFLEAYTARMARAWKAWLLPDGHIPLLNDSTFEIATPPEKLLPYAEAILGPVEPSGDAFPESGYFVHRGPRLHLFWDAGPGGPDHLMAHAHADVLSFELAVDGLRFVVDPGVYQYEEGPDRDFVRSTRAHSTVEVDGRSQFECWKSFRVARRARPRDVRWEAEDGRTSLEGEYPWGEVHGGNVVHRRELVAEDEPSRLRIRDRVTGEGSHRVVAHLPLHPEVAVTPSGAGFRLEREGTKVDVRLSGGEASVEERWVAPEFGLKVPNRVLVLAYEGPLPAELTTEIDVVS